MGIGAVIGASVLGSKVKAIGNVFRKAGDYLGDVMNRATGQTQANQWQWDMWNAQNAYNTPLAQRERLEAAGYNPMLLNSGGSGVAGNAGSMTAKSGSGVSPFEILGAIVNSEVGLAQSAFINEQARQLKHDNDLVEGTPVKSSDNGFMAKIGRLFGWANNTNQGKEVLNSVKNLTGEIAHGLGVDKNATDALFQGAIKAGKPRILKDNLEHVKTRPGARLDEAIRRSEILKKQLVRASSKKAWTGSKKGKYTNLAP